MNQERKTQLERSQERVIFERALVGAVISFSLTGKHPYLAEEVVTISTPEMFIDSRSKAIMQAIRSCVLSGTNIDLLTIADQIKKTTGFSNQFTATDFVQIAQRADDFITYPSIVLAAKKVADEWRKDEASVEIADALRVTHQYGIPVDMAVESLKKAQEILESQENVVNTDFDSRIDEYEKALLENRQVSPLPCPWGNVNRILRGGILPGELAILAARPSVGKSALAMNWAWSSACASEGVEFFSLEMGREQLIDRIVSNFGNMHLGSFRQGLSPKEREHAMQTLELMRGRPLNIYDDTRITVSEVKRRVRVAQRRRAVGLVVIDYLQLVTPEENKVSREQQVAMMSRGFKLMAKELSVPVLLLAQLSRKGEDAHREPVLSDLRESGAIEQDADIVIFLHQAHRTWHIDEPVKVIIAKGRSSGVGKADLIFRRGYQRFEESTEQFFQQAQKEDYAPIWQEGGQDELL